MKKLFVAASLVYLLSFGQAAAASNDTNNGDRLERVAIIMRHGIRPPTKAKFLPDGASNKIWAKWDTPYGHLTKHGGEAIAKIAQFDLLTYGGLVGNSCNNIKIIADNDERTISTAAIYGKTFTNNCNPKVESVPDGAVDKRFAPFEGDAKFDANLMLQAAYKDLPKGGFATIEKQHQNLLNKIDTIIGCCQAPLCDTSVSCSLYDDKGKFLGRNGRVKLEGGLDTASTAAQVLLLEYADGKPMKDVGWGQVSREDIRNFSKFHALEFKLTSRPKAIAQYASKPILAEVDKALFAANAPAVLLMVGHDGNLANIGGALDLHWVAGDLAPDDPSPGGAIIFEKWRKADGREYIVTRYRSQTLDEMRYLRPLQKSATKIITQPLCGNARVCDANKFRSLLK